MSGQMNNVEIEDVLSSIRRLVSEETRTPPKEHPRAEGGQTSKPAGPVDALAGLRAMPSRAVETPEASDKLLLSPAFRVPDVSAANSPEARLVPSPDLASLEATIAELEAAVGAAPGVYEGDGFPGKTPDATVLGGETTLLTSDDAALESEAERMLRVPAFVSRNAPRRDITSETPLDNRKAATTVEDRAFDPARFDAVAFDHAAAQLGTGKGTRTEAEDDTVSPEELAEMDADRAFAATADAIAALPDDTSDEVAEAAIDDVAVMAETDIDEAGFEVVEVPVEDSHSDAAVYNFAEHAAALRAEERVSYAPDTPHDSTDTDTIFEAESEDFTVHEADFADHADVETLDAKFDDADSSASDVQEAEIPVGAAVVLPFAANLVSPPEVDTRDVDDNSAAVSGMGKSEQPLSLTVEADNATALAYAVDSAFGGDTDDFTWHVPDPSIIGAGTVESGLVASTSKFVTFDTVKPASPAMRQAAAEEAPEAAIHASVTAAEPAQNNTETADDLAGADDFSVFEIEETVIDEAALRDLIATIIREELQGALGERITRNVRKLVRAEIQQALAVRDAD